MSRGAAEGGPISFEEEVGAAPMRQRASPRGAAKDPAAATASLLQNVFILFVRRVTHTLYRRMMMMMGRNDEGESQGRDVTNGVLNFVFENKRLKYYLVCIFILGMCCGISCLCALYYCHFINNYVYLDSERFFFSCHMFSRDLYRLIELVKNNSTLMLRVHHFCNNFKLVPLNHSEFLTMFNHTIYE